MSNCQFGVFPAEIWAIIVRSPVLTFWELLRLSEVSSWLHDLCVADGVWERKFKQKWPNEYAEVAAIVNHMGNTRHWQSEFQQRLDIAKLVHRQLRRCARIYNTNDSIPEISDRIFDKLLKELDDQLRTIFVIHELREVLLRTDRYSDLTNKYYARKAIGCLRQCILSKQVDFNEYSLEQSACHFSTWMQPELDVQWPSVDQFLNNLTIQVLQRLSAQNHDHPYAHFVRRPPNHGNSSNSTNNIYSRTFSVDSCESHVLLSRLRETCGRGGTLSDAQKSAVISAINYVFSTPTTTTTSSTSGGSSATVGGGFKGNPDDYYDLANSYIDQVISRRLGIPITLCILYKAIADRLGIPVGITNLPGHMFIVHLAHPGLATNAERYSYVDPYEGCRVVTEAGVWEKIGTILSGRVNRDDWTTHEASTKPQILIRLYTNVQQILEGNHSMHGHGTDIIAVIRAREWMMHLLESLGFDNADKAPVRMVLGRLYSYYGINCDRAVKLLTAMDDFHNRDLMIDNAKIKFAEETRLIDQDPVITGKYRNGGNSSVKYAAGQIMRHKLYGYKCVIRGWDRECAASESWKQNMGVVRLEKGASQPFYHVMAGDGSDRYAAEDNLIFEPEPEEIQHDMIGKYFDQFCQNHYRLNPDLMTLYPDDTEFLAKYVQENYKKESI